MIQYNIAGVLNKFKRDWSGVFEREGLKDLCVALRHKWRNRKLPPVRTIELLLMQVLHGNTAITALRHLSGTNFSASAYCQARARLPIELLNRILERMGKRSRRDGTKGWLGHRTFLIDGSSFSMPDTPELRRHFGYPSGQKKGCGFPVGHLLALFDSSTKMVSKLVPGKLFTHDLEDVPLIHPELEKGDVIVGDRAFCSFAHMASLCQKGIHATFRMHQSLSKAVRHKGNRALRCNKRLGEGDYLCEWRKPKPTPSWMKKKQFKALPNIIQIRRLHYKVTRRGFRSRHIFLLTTLIDPTKYPAEELAALYNSRWEIELNFRHLKTSMKMDVLKCKTVSSILKELLAFAIVYNLICLVMLEAATRQNVAVQRISFVDASRWLIREIVAPHPLVLIVNPERSPRFEPRAIKRRPKQYDRLNKPRHSYKLAA